MEIVLIVGPTLSLRFLMKPKSKRKYLKLTKLYWQTLPWCSKRCFLVAYPRIQAEKYKSLIFHRKRFQLRHIYTDEMILDSGYSVTELFCAAKKYMLHPLAQHCVKALLKILTSENVLEIFEFANFHELQELLVAALKVSFNQFFISIFSNPFCSLCPLNRSLFGKPVL